MIVLTLEQLHGKMAPLAEGANLLYGTPRLYPLLTYSLLAIYLILRYN